MKGKRGGKRAKPNPTRKKNAKGILLDVWKTSQGNRERKKRFPGAVKKKKKKNSKWVGEKRSEKGRNRNRFCLLLCGKVNAWKKVPSKTDTQPKIVCGRRRRERHRASKKKKFQEEKS